MQQCGAEGRRIRGVQARYVQRPPTRCHCHRFPLVHADPARRGHPLHPARRRHLPQGGVALVSLRRRSCVTPASLLCHSGITLVSLRRHTCVIPASLLRNAALVRGSCSGAPGKWVCPPSGVSLGLVRPGVSLESGGRVAWVYSSGVSGTPLGYIARVWRACCLGIKLGCGGRVAWVLSSGVSGTSLGYIAR
eukprot:912420-Prorocentrum_minimum.AAC.1